MGHLGPTTRHLSATIISYLGHLQRHRVYFTTSDLFFRLSSTMGTRCACCSRLYIDRLLDQADLNPHGSPSVVHDNSAYCSHQQSLQDLEASAKQGCDFCHFLHHCISSHSNKGGGQILISVHSQNGSTGIVESLLVRIGYETLHLRLLTSRGKL